MNNKGTQQIIIRQTTTYCFLCFFHQGGGPLTVIFFCVNTSYVYQYRTQNTKGSFFHYFFFLQLDNNCSVANTSSLCCKTNPCCVPFTFYLMYVRFVLKRFLHWLISLYSLSKFISSNTKPFLMQAEIVSCHNLPTDLLRQTQN